MEIAQSGLVHRSNYLSVCPVSVQSRIGHNIFRTLWLIISHTEDERRGMHFISFEFCSYGRIHMEFAESGLVPGLILCLSVCPVGVFAG